MPTETHDPELGDVYMASPETTPFGDAHGDNARPVGVAELNKRVVSTLTRTTHPTRDCRKLESPANLRLDLVAGWWTDHKPRPIPRRWFGTHECRFRGPLDDDEREEFLRFWQTTKMLGRV